MNRREASDLPIEGLTFTDIQRAVEQLEANNPGPRGDGYYMQVCGQFMGPFDPTRPTTEEEDKRLEEQLTRLEVRYFSPPHLAASEHLFAVNPDEW